MSLDFLNPPAAAGPALFNAILKQQAGDFQVRERLELELSGAGDQLYLHVEKSSMNTDELVALLIDIYKVQQVDVGLCGLKDRHAVTSQWFSIKTGQSAEEFSVAVEQFNAEQIARFADSDGYCKQLRLLDSSRHARKLRRGAHAGNDFVITLHDVSASTEPDVLHSNSLQEAVAQRLALIAANGFPAYVGPQRFGQDGQNLRRAQQWFSKPRKRTSRQQRSLWLSAVRSALFNHVCAARVRDGSWNHLKVGEPAVLDGTRSYFLAHMDEPDQARQDAVNLSAKPVDAASLSARLANFDIHPSAPWWGRGRSIAAADCAQFETQLLAEHAALCEGLERGGLSQERRALRAVATNLTHQWLAPETLEISLSLAPGVFATSFLRELCAIREPQR